MASLWPPESYDPDAPVVPPSVPPPLPKPLGELKPLDTEKVLVASTGNVPTPTHKAISDVLTRYAERLGQLPISDALVVEPLGVTEVKGRPNVLAVMRGLFQDLKIAETIVILPPVDVVDVLRGEQAAPEMPGHDPTVFVNLFPVNTDNPVAGNIQSVGFLPFNVACATAKGSLLTGVDRTTVPKEVFAARSAGEGDFHEQ